MKMELEYAELHAPLFLGGVNLAAKLDPTKRVGMTLEYDRTEKELRIVLETPNGTKETFLPSTSVLHYVPGTPKRPGGKPAVVAPAGPIVAQVSSPTDHVFAGLGKGKTK